MGRVKRLAVAAGKGTWKVGAVVAKVGGKTAGKGSVWVLRKVAVDPVAMKVQDWSVVKGAVKGAAKVAELREALKKHGQCVGCGKVFREHKQREFCTPKCASDTADSWNEYKRESVQPAVVADNDLHLNCGCNRKNLFHGAGCAVGLSGHRVADNIKWSESNPKHMKPAAPERKRKLTPQEEHRERVREAQEADKAKKWWQKKDGLK